MYLLFMSLSSDVFVHDNVTAWFNFNSPTLELEIAALLHKHHIPFNNYFGTFMGGPTGLWSSRPSTSFEKHAVIPNLYVWVGVKDFIDCEFQWFSNSAYQHYFNAKGNVYTLIDADPCYELVWENCKILQLNGERENARFNACLLDNGQVWAIDNDKIPANEHNWKLLSFFNDKNVKQVLPMDEICYILCECPEQKLFYYSFQSESADDLPPIEDITFKSKTIVKMVKLEEIVLFWCKEGIYAWVIYSGATPHELTLLHPVYKFPEVFFPLKYFEDKKILDIASGENFYILCDDGMYAIYSSTCGLTETDNPPMEGILVKLDSYFEENVPNIFSYYHSTKIKLGKSARSQINTEEPAAKKQKIVHEEN